MVWANGGSVEMGWVATRAGKVGQMVGYEGCGNVWGLQGEAVLRPAGLGADVPPAPIGFRMQGARHLYLHSSAPDPSTAQVRPSPLGGEKRLERIAGAGEGRTLALQHDSALHSGANRCLRRMGLRIKQAHL